MTKQASKLLALALCCFLAPSQLLAQDLEKIAVKKIEFSPQNNLEITLEKKTEFKAFYLQNPDRLVIDIVNADAAKPVFECALPGFVKSHREGVQKNSLRLVFDLNQKISVNKSSYQKLKDQDFGRIIIELEGIEKPAEQTNDSRYRLTNDQNKPAKIVIPKTPIIVIDPGHGGKDPGTIGDYARTKEKNLTLAYAKELKKSLENTKHYKVYLTREEDFFIPLQDRVGKARKLKADLFISLHANSIAQASTKGFSIYTLSKKSSDKQAEMLAQKENRVDILAGVNFSGASPDIMKTLIDLSQRDSMNSSSRFANIVIRALSKSEIKVLQNTHRFAGFAVLTATDMSSVLIELGYLSNQHEEKQLNNLIYKRKIVASITDAIDEYFNKNLKPTKTASKHE